MPLNPSGIRHWTVFDATAAPGAFFHINAAGAFSDFYLEISGRA
jgi:hypothetical protein